MSDTEINKEIETLINDSDILGIEDQILVNEQINFLLNLKEEKPMKFT